ncbi:UDP-glucose dehydrogenase family protein [Cellvibrio polysaccharolyticus]|uniref:UDP-glucose 6-dehydrogenase n=1 Tax=Cellvibrio polysaccharolyticus TaxID=2082724 RepID=A0A928V5S5_9GAMM|nr:UDP-glucose/GDP-mannose dehydrogenase family protein [Cellvibrio polysaccharolyticus]MBE8717381.1 UDP-glucose/GDP-mannose dehydrogenase family protein [Cellvibrio polysaccharolyticus]
MKVTVFGTGYVGLVTGTCLADVGHDVLCVDIDQKKVDNLNNGIIPIYEPGLESLVRDAVQNGLLHFTTDPKRAVDHGELQFIAVGTPSGEDGSADLQYVVAVAKTIGELMDGYKVVVNKSTVPVGTAEKVQAAITEQLSARKSSLAFDVVSNPEFLKEGAAVNDFMKPDRIVVGTDSEQAEKRLRELYAPFNRNHDRMVFMDVRSAELTKYAANAMLATKISFINEMANLAERLGADIEQVRNGIGADPRIGYHFIYPGCGYGGSCFPKDVKALINIAKGVDYSANLMEAVDRVNQAQKSRLVDYIHQHFGKDLNGKTFALWGLAFKPNTDDMREAPSRVLMEALWAAGAKVQAFDPVAMEETQHIYGLRDDLKLTGTKEAALEKADALVICTEWKNFRAPDFELLKRTLNAPVIFDGRNLYDPARLEEYGFEYYAVGRGKSVQRFS